MSRSLNTESRMSPREINGWIRLRSKTTRVRGHGFTRDADGGVRPIVSASCKPTTAEFRRWLRSKDTPRPVKGKLYAWLLYRRETRG